MFDNLQQLFSNDMDAQEMHKALSRVWEHHNKELVKPPYWETIKRRDRFEQVIAPDGCNLVDYMKVDEAEFSRVGLQIDAIDAALNEGIAIVGLQMSNGQDMARGGSLTLDTPKAYVTLHKIGVWDKPKGQAWTPRQKTYELGWKRMVKIEKARHWAGDKDPEGQYWGYNLVSGGFDVEGLGVSRGF